MDHVTRRVSAMEPISFALSHELECPVGGDENLRPDELLAPEHCNAAPHLGYVDVGQTHAIAPIQLKNLQHSHTPLVTARLATPTHASSSTRPPTRMSKQRTVAPLASNPMESDQRQKAVQAKRKSEIEKKSRQKRLSNIDTMKAKLASLEQALQCLMRTETHGETAFIQPQLPLHMRLAKLRQLVASQAVELSKLRTEQFNMYQQVEHHANINESLKNVFRSYDFTDTSVYDLLAWWKPPSDAECLQIAAESMDVIRDFKFSSHSVKASHGDWSLHYDISSGKGCKFHFSRNLYNIDRDTVTGSVWGTRCDSSVASRLGGSLCKVEMTVLKTLSKDMMVVNRSISGPTINARSLYLLFRVIVDDVYYIGARELGRSKDVTWHPDTREFPQTSPDKWVDMFTWTMVAKLPPGQYPPNSYSFTYGGWWGANHTMGVDRWMQELVFMVVRWESMFLNPRSLTF